MHMCAMVEVSASKEAGLAQEIRGTSFEHLLLHATSVALGHWASTTSAIQALCGAQSSERRISQ